MTELDRIETWRSTPQDHEYKAETSPLVSVVICTLDEHEAIGGVLEAVSADLAATPNEIIVVDDSADERTAEAVAACARRLPSVRLIRRRGGRGLASAAIAGWDAAHGEALAIMDGDGQHDPRLVGLMLRRLGETGAEVVVASRYTDGAACGLSGARRLLSRAGVGLARLLLGLRLADPMSGCFLMRRDWYAAARPRLSGLGFKILIDVVVSGDRPPAVEQVPTALRARAGGRSKLDLRVSFDLIALLVEKRSGGAVPARLFQFLLVGATGVAAHLAVLGATQLAGLPFWAGQTAAVMAAMTWNFMLNNSLTFRDRRLRGSALWRGLLSFYAACLGGALLSDLAGSALNAAGAPWAAAGVAGAVIAGLWNYHAARRVTWRETAGATDEAGRAPVAAARLAQETRA